jgi:hypothetical protein
LHRWSAFVLVGSHGVGRATRCSRRPSARDGRS